VSTANQTLRCASRSLTSTIVVPLPCVKNLTPSALETEGSAVQGRSSRLGSWSRSPSEPNALRVVLPLDRRRGPAIWKRGSACRKGKSCRWTEGSAPGARSSSLLQQGSGRWSEGSCHEQARVRSFERRVGSVAPRIHAPGRKGPFVGQKGPLEDP